ncbi:histidine phosphatase family protein [Nonomuraea pusilla]|uniref:Broad specificity phosphatase PhoE n=1 Tax=Nonomuraea pusilla TaxID=46177 RepID=A0A1H7LBV8_9ACTN|nr:histidine phosphatase family protein [Nonomuraea pusilla]SEK95827.1 Broad specificity phosphatase PhoE [Nonomuraea pusilla]
MGPARITAVRHGESEANVAYARAGDAPLVYGFGDDEVGLTPRGRSQAEALGRRLAALPEGESPELVWSSPYLRAVQTWEVAGAAWRGEPPPVTVDARLRDVENGLLARLNPAAVRERFPEEAARLLAEGPYVYRPPGGESFADVVARLRAFLAELAVRADGRRVLLVAHDSVILGLRLAIAGTPDGEAAAAGAYAPVLNASVSTWHAARGRLELVAFNDTSHLDG